MEFRAARRDERDEVLDLLALWYGDRDFFARYNQHDPRFRDELCMVACVRSRIVATVQIFDRAVNLAGQSVPLGGIGSVYTHETYRNQGIASALIRLAIETMAREAFEISLLFAERTDFYARFGWNAIARRFTVMTGAENLDADASARLELFDPARDLRDIAQLYRCYSGRFNVTAVRDEAYWSGNLRYAGNPAEHFVVAHDALGIAAYARAMRFHGIPMVMEYGYRPDSIGAMLSLFRHLGSASASMPIEADEVARHAVRVLAPPDSGAASSLLVTHSAHDPELEAGLRGSGCFLMHHDDNFYMWRVVLADRFARRFDVAEEAADA